MLLQRAAGGEELVHGVRGGIPVLGEPLRSVLKLAEVLLRALELGDGQPARLLLEGKLLLRRDRPPARAIGALLLSC